MAGLLTISLSKPSHRERAHETRRRFDSDYSCGYVPARPFSLPFVLCRVSDSGCLMKVNTAITEARVKSMLEGRTEASAWSLNRSTGLTIDRVRHLMQRAGVKDMDAGDKV